MKKVISYILLASTLLLIGYARAGTTISLYTPSSVPLTPAVSVTGCAAIYATVDAYRTVITGFSSAGDYVLGQVSSHFTCGHSGRGSTIHTYHLCTYLQWDLSGNLVSTNTPTLGAHDDSCTSIPLNPPSFIPPSNSVVGNAFENAGGYVAQTVVEEVCGSVACYEMLFLPELVTP